jgi:hypothetical protein
MGEPLGIMGNIVLPHCSIRNRDRILFPRQGHSFVGMLYILMWMQVFLIGTGCGLKELYSHYI